MIKVNYKPDNHWNFYVFDRAGQEWPSTIDCHHCEGEGGHMTPHRYDYYTPDDYWWNGCDYCQEGKLTAGPKTRLVNRYTLRKRIRAAA